MKTRAGRETRQRYAVELVDEAQKVQLRRLTKTCSGGSASDRLEMRYFVENFMREKSSHGLSPKLKRNTAENAAESLRGGRQCGFAPTSNLSTLSEASDFFL